LKVRPKGKVNRSVDYGILSVSSIVMLSFNTSISWYLSSFSCWWRENDWKANYWI